MSGVSRLAKGSLLGWLILVWLVPVAGANAPLFELIPEKDDRFSIGRVAIVEGLAHPDGVRLVLRNLSIDTPVQITLVAEDDDLVIQTYTADWSQPLGETETDDGEVTLRFRTADSAQFLIKGDDDVRYQLFVWVGPEMKQPVPSIFITSEEFEETEGGGFGKFLMLILLAGGGYYYFRIRNKGTAGTAMLILAVSTGWLMADVNAASADPESLTELLRPERIKQTEESKRTNAAVNELRKRLDALPKTGVSQFDDAVKHTKLIIAFLEQFGFLDPREAAVRPDYDPAGLPPLPSRCYDDPRGKCAACFAESKGDLDKWRGLLEDLWVIYKQTEMETGRIIELADAAAGMSPLANFVWKVSKSNPNEAHVKAKATFYATYDENYNELIKRLNNGLIDVGNCEQKYYDDDDWYNRYGLPYYLFMRDRYQRK